MNRYEAIVQIVRSVPPRHRFMTAVLGLASMSIPAVAAILMIAHH